MGRKEGWRVAAAGRGLGPSRMSPGSVVGGERQAHRGADRIVTACEGRAKKKAIGAMSISLRYLLPGLNRMGWRRPAFARSAADAGPCDRPGGRRTRTSAPN